MLLKRLNFKPKLTNENKMLFTNLKKIIIEIFLSVDFTNLLKYGF